LPTSAAGSAPTRTDDRSSALHIERLDKVYAGGVRALDGLSLRIPVGCFFGLLGRTGPGRRRCAARTASIGHPRPPATLAFLVAFAAAAGLYLISAKLLTAGWRLKP
jgi:hypothetical protein